MACFQHRQLGTGRESADEPIPFAEPGVAPQYPPSRAVRIVRSTVALSVAPAEATFTGRAILELAPYPTFTGEITLDLDEVEVVEVTDGAGAALPYTLGDGRLTVLPPDRGLPAALKIRWRGRSPRRGLYFTGPIDADPDRPHTAWTQCQDEDGHFVFPCHDHPSVKHPWTLEIDAPAGYTVLSNGERVDGGERDGRTWARFEQRDPMPAYLVTFVAAPLAVIEASWRGRPVRYLFPAGSEAEAQRAFGRTPEMIERFSAITGVDYPWPRYDQVVVHEFVFGGMENVACTTMTDLILVDEKAALEQQAEGLVAHELAHQWFGDLVTCEDWSQAWLNESWATLMEAVWVEHVEPADEATWYRWSTAQGYHAEHAGRYRRPIVSYEYREPIDLFDRHLYNKGSCVLWTLRHELGDAAFWGGVRAYLTANGHDTVHTRNFQRAMERATGRNLERFFRQWLYQAGHPVVDVVLARDGDAQVAVTVRQTQTGADVPACFAFALRVGIVDDAGNERTFDLAISERERTFVLPTERPPARVRVDPGYRVLAEIKLDGPVAWLEALLADPCPVLAVRAAKALIAAGSRRGLEAVERALASHPFHGVRGAIAAELGRVGTPGVEQVLVAALTRETDPRARRTVAQALGSFRQAAAADALLHLLDEDLPTWHLEGAALVALGQTRDPRARAALEARAGRASWGDTVRQRALEGLAETGDPEVLATLVAHSRPAYGDRTRAAAAAALGRLCELTEGVRTQVIDRLVEMCTETGFRAQLAAIGALGKIRDARAEPALSRTHRSAPDGRTRRAAYEALARIRQGRTSDEGLASIRRRLDALAETNALLRDRIDRLER